MDRFAGSCVERISIHAPREGCDTASRWSPTRISHISIHAPREGCDTQEWTSYLKIWILHPFHGINCTVRFTRIFPDMRIR